MEIAFRSAYAIAVLPNQVSRQNALRKVRKTKGDEYADALEQRAREIYESKRKRPMPDNVVDVDEIKGNLSRLIED